MSYFEAKTILMKIEEEQGKLPDVINVTGGEPLLNPEFFRIYSLCYSFVKKNGIVWVHTNVFKHIMFNANVIPGIHVQANLPLLDNTEKVHILKMVEQGKYKKPEVHLSKNWEENECKECNHIIVMPDGSFGKVPCKKFEKSNEQSRNS